jgi:hypothetical protein
MNSSLRSLLVLSLYTLWAAAASAQLEQTFTINLNSTDFTQSGCDDLVVQATGTASCVGTNEITWRLDLDGAQIAEYRDRLFGIFGNTGFSHTFVIPPRSGVYTLHKGLTYGGDWDSQAIKVTLASACTPPEKGKLLHVIGTAPGTAQFIYGHLWHTIRFDAAGTWQDFRDVEQAAGLQGAFVDVDAALVNGELHVVAVGADGHLWHTIRSDTGWQPFQDVGQAVGRSPNFSGAFERVSVAAVGGTLHVCALDDGGHAWHTIRFATSWQPFFGNLSDPTGPPDDGDAFFIDVACVAVDGDLHVALVNSSGDLYHTIRFSGDNRFTAKWQTYLGNVRSVASYLPEKFARVGAGEVNGELHLCMTTKGGNVYHTIRHTSSWQFFGDVFVATGRPPDGFFVDISCRQSGGELHVVGVTNHGQLWHTIRHEHSWDGFADIEKTNAGERGVFTSVGIAGDLVP